MIRAALLIAGILGCCLHCSGPARAEVAVSPELVCTVQNAIRHKLPAWQPAMCSEVARAVNAAPRPRLALAMAILESDLRAGVAVEARPGVFDVGLMQVRCVLYPSSSAPARGDGPRSAGSSKSADQAGGRCQNGPALGHTLAELKTPAINISVAVAIVAEKRERHGNSWARFYNGATHENGYGRRVDVLAAALGGVRLATKSKRVRKLVQLILAALAPQNATGEAE